MLVHSEIELTSHVKAESWVHKFREMLATWKAEEEKKKEREKIDEKLEIKIRLCNEIV